MIAVDLGTYTLLCIITGIAIGIVITLVIVNINKSFDK